MRILKKSTAVLLSALMLMSLFSVAVSAASGTLKVEAVSNVAPTVTNSYDLAKDSTVTFTFKAKTAYKIANSQGSLTYDHNYLTLTSFALKKVGGQIVNSKPVDHVYFNSTDISTLADFSKGEALATATFKIVKAGSTGISFDIEELNAIDGKADIPVISDGVIKDSKAAFTLALSANASQKAVKKANPVKVKAVKKTVKAKKLAKKAQTVKKSLKVTKAQGKVTYKKVKKGSTAKLYKKVTVNSKTGAIKIKKGKLAKKTYKLVVSVKAAGNTNYNAKTVKKTVKIKVK